MHEKQPNNPHFVGRMCRIYVELSDEQAQCTSFTALNVVRLIIEMFIYECLVVQLEQNVFKPIAKGWRSHAKVYNFV